MSSYTTEVRYICESTAGLTDSADFNSIDNVLSKETVDKIFNFDYPIFDETYRYPLNKKILRHFYTREIGEETVGLWKLRLQQTLNEVMPYYNKLYKLELDKINPFYSVDLTTTRHTTGNERTDETNSLNKTKTGNTNTTKNEQSNNSKTENANENKTGDKTRFIDEGHNDTTKTDTGTNKTINSNENSNTNKNETNTNNGTENVSNNISKNKTSAESISGTGGETINRNEKTTKVGTDNKNRTQNTQDKGQKDDTYTGERWDDGTKNVTGSNNNTNNSTDRYSDTPQGGLEGMQAIQQNLYLTNARLVNGGNSGTNKEDTTTSEKEQTEGTNGSKYSDTGKLTEKITDATKEMGQDTEKTTKNLTNKQTKDITGNDTEQGTKTGTKNSTQNVNSSSNTTTNGNKTENGNTNTNEVKQGNINREENEENTEKNTFKKEATDIGKKDASERKTNNENENATGRTNTTVNNTEEYVERVTGYKGNKALAEIIIEWRKNLLNIDRMILRDLEDCFFQLW